MPSLIFFSRGVWEAWLTKCLSCLSADPIDSIDTRKYIRPLFLGFVGLIGIAGGNFEKTSRLGDSLTIAVAAPRRVAAAEHALRQSHRSHLRRVGTLL